MPDSNLSPAETAEIEHALAHALQFDGRKQFRVSGDLMAKITAAHLVKCLKRAGFAVMKRAGVTGYRAPKYRTDERNVRRHWCFGLWWR